MSQVRRTPWRDVVQVMGLPISVALRGRHAGDDVALTAWARVQADLHAVDAMFSRYRDDSWVSLFNSGHADVADAPAEVREVLTLAEAARSASDGAFDVRRPGVDGRTLLDTDGVVKGWAVQRAARHLIALDDTDVCLGGGGDLVCWTAEAESAPWQIGIEDPHDPGSIVARVPITRGAVATSSAAHRGTHIVDARTGRPPQHIASVTVLAPDLVTADVDATAAFAQGAAALRWLRSRPGRGGLIVWGDGSVETV
ncbi:FAD:protein FMN transferase [Nocardioides sp.]|uniref:FAD:protein FMN transferase n=1 Tax=Nocardioides sp. TaxID=35761 RepID=UPI00286DFB1F|nr:FAD:protein FMN transferase [Nocardioides sp.]